MEFQWVAFVLLLWPGATLQRSDVNSTSYMAAIVEYSPVVYSINEDNLGELNAKNYLKIIDKAIGYGVDIIVFPESSLAISTSKNATIARSQAASYIPDPSENIIPCDATSKPWAYSLRSISCAAKHHQIYVLINHREKVDCTPGKAGCPGDGLLIYNTNVAFDRKGKVIARYRKYNLFGEYDKNITEPIATTFDTDFGVKFGTITCFDLLFETPAMNLTRDLGVTDILFPTYWFSELPYLYAVEAQAAWAYANDVNLLASSFNYPDTASGSGGIFVGKQGYIEVVSEDKKSNILVIAEIPKVINGKRTQNINRDKVHIYSFTTGEIITGEKSGRGQYLHLVDDLSPYSTELIDLKQKSHNRTLCNRGFCCDFKLTINFDGNSIKNDLNYYRYRYAVFNGTRTFNNVATGGIKSCGIISCINDTLNGCGRIFQGNDNAIMATTFMSLEISIRDISDQSTFFMPITFTRQMIPLNATDFSYKSIDSGKSSTYHMELTKPLNNLLTFSIYGRNFATDGAEVTKAFASKIVVSPILFLTAVIVVHAIFTCPWQNY